MPTPDIVRDSFFGQLVYYASGRRFCRYPEEKPGFVLPEQYARPMDTTSEHAIPPDVASEITAVVGAKVNGITDDKTPASVTIARAEDVEQKPPQESALAQEYLHHSDADVEKTVSTKETRQDPNLVDWYGPDDPESPANWSMFKCCLVTFDICLITFAIYIGSALYAPGIPDMADKFGISQVAASLGLTMFVVGYGIGPMILSPLSELPQLGRAPVYMVTLIIFVVLQVPTALAHNIGSVIVLRFLAGIFGSPPLSTGGASLADIWAPEDRAAVLGLWGLSAMAGPAVGPILGGFVAQSEEWRWTMWILLWLGGGSTVFLALFMPETSAQPILYRRAVRLRRLTGNQSLRSQGEIDGQSLTIGDMAMTTLVRPFILGFCEPIIAFWNIYISLVYGILYCFISSFDVVFIGNHHFNLGENGLAFIGIICGVAICYFCFLPWAVLSLKPRFKRGTFVPEDRLPLAMFGAVLLPTSMFWFGWTSAGSIHWISPILASAVWAASAFLLFQAGLNYLADCYPRYVASVLAGNDLFRSMLGAAFPLFSTAFFRNLGVGPACSILGSVGVAMLPIPFVLYQCGSKIRSWSRYAD